MRLLFIFVAAIFSTKFGPKINFDVTSSPSL